MLICFRTSLGGQLDSQLVLIFQEGEQSLQKAAASLMIGRP